MTVVLSPGLVVSPAPGESDLYPYIGWHNVVDMLNVSAEHEALGYPATNLANPSTVNRWKSDSTAEQTITIGFLEAGDAVDYVALAGHNFGTSGAAVSVEGEVDGSFVEVFAGITPGDNSPLLIRFEKAFYTRIRITVGAGSVVPFASVLFVGELIIIPTGIAPGYTSIKDGRKTDFVTGRSEVGEYLGSIVVGAQLETSTPLTLLPRAWYDANLRPFIAGANNGDPFFFAWSPVTRPDQIGYCWLSTDARPVISQVDGSYDITLPLSGVAA